MRHLLCPPCAHRTPAAPPNGSKTITVPADENGPAEGERFVWGTLHTACVCDFCGRPIPAGSRALAHSAWPEANGPVRPWESEHLEVEA